MPRAGLSTAAVIERAAQLLDEHGSESLNLAAVATSFGVKIPSLYKHVDGVQGLRRGIMLAAKAELTAAMEQAAVGRSRDDAIRGIAVAYRKWALKHPGQYPLTVRAPMPDDADDEAVSAASVAVIFAVLAGYSLRDDDAVDATRFLRSALHGFVSLETGGAFELPVDRERSFGKLVESVVTALAAWGSGPESVTTSELWLPAGWQHPTHVSLPTGHHLRPIRASDTELDMDAVMGSRERLWSIYGEAWGWPPATMTAEQDRADLQRHADEMQTHESFNFALFDENETELIGCVYIDPSDDETADADVSWWVRDEYVGTELEAALDTFVPAWIERDWPLTNPRFDQF